MCDLGSFPACIFFEAAAQPFGFGHVAFAGPVAFTDNGVFHPLHVFAVLTVVALYHFVFIASHNISFMICDGTSRESSCGYFVVLRSPVSVLKYPTCRFSLLFRVRLCFPVTELICSCTGSIGCSGMCRQIKTGLYRSFQLESVLFVSVRLPVSLCELVDVQGHVYTLVVIARRNGILVCVVRYFAQYTSRFPRFFVGLV